MTERLKILSVARDLKRPAAGEGWDGRTDGGTVDVIVRLGEIYGASGEFYCCFIDVFTVALTALFSTREAVMAPATRGASFGGNLRDAPLRSEDQFEHTTLGGGRERGGEGRGLGIFLEACPNKTNPFELLLTCSQL